MNKCELEEKKVTMKSGKNEIIRSCPLNDMKKMI